jgi:hypothetical protein
MMINSNGNAKPGQRRLLPGQGAQAVAMDAKLLL